MFLARSTDFGETWATAAVSDPRGRTGEDSLVEKPVTSLAVDTVNGQDDIVYVDGAGSSLDWRSPAIRWWRSPRTEADPLPNRST